MATIVGGNLGAFLDMIAAGEIGKSLLDVSDNGYNVIVGSTPSHPILFGSYKDHPRQRVFLSMLHVYSTAAGRYQILSRYYDAYKKDLRLPDFSPSSQDAIAIQQIKEQGAYGFVRRGDITVAINLCKNIWASLPGAGYGQNEQKEEYLIAEYQKAGGLLA